MQHIDKGLLTSFADGGSKLLLFPAESEAKVLGHSLFPSENEAKVPGHSLFPAESEV